MDIIEDYYADHPDLQPWDPRIKSIAVQDFPHGEHGGFLDATYFIIYLHCARKIGWAITNDLLAQISVSMLREFLQKEIQPVIDKEYKHLQEMAGGAVDIYGKPILTVSVDFVPVWKDDDLQAISTSLVIAQLTDEEQYDAWLKQAVNCKQTVTPSPGKHKWYDTGFVTANPIQQDVGSIVQRNLKKLFPALNELVVCPGCKLLDKKYSGALDAMIIHLNDTHRWTREAVADWLESLDIDLGMKENV